MARYAISEDFLRNVERLQSVLKNNLAGMFGGNHKSKTIGSSCEFTDHREYIPGDDVTKIDWNAYARFDELYVRRYADERRMHTRIYIDASRSMEFGDGNKAVRALEVAATLAYLSVVELDKVSIYAVKDGAAECVVSGMVGREGFFDGINAINDIDFGGECGFDAAITPEGVGYGDGMSVLISDFLGDPDYEAAIDRIVGKKRDLLCVQVLTREEINPQIRGKNCFFDSEKPGRSYKKNITREIVQAYRQAVEYVRSRIRDYCSARGGAFISVSDDKPTEEIFFGDLVESEVLK